MIVVVYIFPVFLYFRIIASLPVYTQRLLVLLFGTFRVIASNSEKANTGMTSEALGVSVAPSFFHTCVSDGKTAKMEDVMRYKVNVFVKCHFSFQHIYFFGEMKNGLNSVFFLAFPPQSFFFFTNTYLHCLLLYNAFFFATKGGSERKFYVLSSVFARIFLYIACRWAIICRFITAECFT